MRLLISFCIVFCPIFANVSVITMFKRSSEVVRVRNPKNFDTALLASSSGPETYNCEFCAQEWHSETELHYHKRSHFRRIQNNISKDSHFCWTCIRSFKSRETLVTHFKVCHLLSSANAQRVEREIFVCDECTCIFFNKEMLVLHLKAQHRSISTKKQYFDCSSCHRSVNIKSAWNHVHFHDMVGLRVCAICFKRFLSWKDLSEHANTHQSYLHCDICNVSYDKLNFFTHHLEKHKRSEEDDHDDEKPESVDTIKLINKYFVPNNWNVKKAKYQNLLPYQGLKLQGDITVCILCREMCMTYNERKQHTQLHNNVETPHVKEEAVTHVREISKDSKREQILPKIVCSCGESFSYKILLKQHLLRNKGSGFAHEELSESDIAHLISVKNDSTTVVEMGD